MAQWAIGDVQGCLNALQRLTHSIYSIDTNPTFYFCGDLVNRGEDSLGTLKFIQSLGQSAYTVLGNHDLFALACVAGFKRPKIDDTFDAMLAAPDKWVDWLRRQPLALDIDQQFLLTHAGVWPSWTVADTLQWAKAVETALQADDWQIRLKQLWDGQIKTYSDELNLLDQQRFTVNALMRMRFIAPDGSLDFAVKTPPNATPRGYTPWFECPSQSMKERVLVFGHWSALGLRNEADWIALDSGCVWGGLLSAVELCLDPSLRRIVQANARAD
jgi:bis(5'-nucleosyl)-tetraphosphatase (symmetrical)